MEENRKVFAFVAENEVFHFMTIPDEPQFQGVIAGLQSGPQLIDVTGNEEILSGGFWKYIDGKFEKQVYEEYLDDYEVE